MFYVVVVLHNRSSGKWCDAIQTTTSASEAVRTARSLERLGYQCNQAGTGATIYRFKLDKKYSRRVFDNIGVDMPFDCPVLLKRYRLGDNSTHWHEEWFNVTTIEEAALCKTST